MKKVLGLSVVLAVAQAADIEVGKELAGRFTSDAVAACHGANGVSVQSRVTAAGIHRGAT